MCPDILARSQGFTEPIQAQGLAVSPDGSQVGMLYVRHGQSYLSLFDVETGAIASEIKLPCGQAGGATWSPDGSHIAFYGQSLRAPTADVFVLAIRTGEIRNLTEGLGRHAFIPSWSPDGKTLAFSAYVPPTGTVPPHPFTVSIAAGDTKQWTFGDLRDVSPKFAPNGTSLAFIRGWDLWLLDLASGEARPLVNVDDNELHQGCFSPGGTNIVFQSNRSLSSQVATVDVETGAIRGLTERDGSALRPSWSPSADLISFVQDGQKAVIISPSGEQVGEVVPSGGKVMAGHSSAPVWAQRAEVLSLMDGDGNIWVAGPDMRPRQVTFFPKEAPLPYAPKDVAYPSTDGVSVPALLLQPPDFRPGRSAAVVWLHGGPSGHAQQDLEGLCRPYIEAMLDAGFVVLAPDYRGSTGHGAEWEWVKPDQRRRMVDLEDAVSAKRYLVTSGIAHPEQIAVVGDSYGGYLTLMALGRHPDDWACGASLWGLFDPRRLPWAFHDEDGKLPDLTDQTPMNLLGQMRGPLLILHGAQDTMSTTEEVTTAHDELIRRGHICELRIFEDDTHGLPLRGQDACDRLVSFLRQHLHE